MSVRAVKPFRLMLLPIWPPSAPPSVTPGTLRSASDSEFAPWLCSSALLSTVTDCGTSFRSADSLLSDVLFLPKSLSAWPSTSTSCTPMGTRAGRAISDPVVGRGRTGCFRRGGRRQLVVGAVCDQTGVAAVSASRAEAIGVRRFISSLCWRGECSVSAVAERIGIILIHFCRDDNPPAYRPHTLRLHLRLFIELPWRHDK